ncbi:phage integrase SAM-like domain-containing protein [Sphingomonas sp. MG17]|uniref:Phage integrase SAM-like domain-containing protein n=1 Tax=Sphingomonas tagetis TaxID=2949092 RepID=A0A9X2HT86_9SPHN|nr:phage integrase SAM-like domain-containing protein [Sphingomonas tagetis]MCP3732215.1 phage integrase SAM-like domain-containing protein [Sphingomonas tagetis]
MLVLRAITDYLVSNENLPSIKSVRPRLNHVVRYIATLETPDIRCSRVDEPWIERFRAWMRRQPVISSAGNTRDAPRSESSIENSVIQLAAAINAAKERGDISRPPGFKPIPTKELNRTPQRRLSVAELATAFRYATDPRYPTKRLGLHRFLMLSVGTAARPDAVHDFSTAADRRQWHEERSVIALNPYGRRQTRKRRAIVVAPPQLAERISETEGFFIPFVSVKSAWETMVAKLGWPTDGEGGMKLIRRSVAQLLRDAGTPRAWSAEWRDPARKVPAEQIEVQLGHRVIDSVTDLYSAFDPAYQYAATAALAAIIDAIIDLCPSAYISLAESKHDGQAFPTAPAASHSK